MTDTRCVRCHATTHTRGIEGDLYCTRRCLIDALNEAGRRTP